MRVLMVANVTWFNATSWYALTLGKLLQESGRQVRIAVLPGSDTMKKALEMGLPVEPMPLNTVSPVGLARLCARINTLLKDFRPHIVNCHRGEAFIIWGALRRATGAFRLIRTRGDQRLPKNNLPNRWLHNQAADAVVSTNSRMHEHFKAKFNTPDERLFLIRGGVDTNTFAFDPAGRARVRQEFGFTDNNLVIGLAGRFDRVKGQYELIRAVSNLYHQHKRTQIRLMLLGFETATTDAQVRAWLQECNITHITAITGKRHDLSACMSAFDMGVSASLYSETIARAPLEIMACNRPLLATSTGVLPDFIPPEALVPGGDADALAELLKKTVDSPELLSKIHQQEQELMPQYTHQAFLAQSLRMYEQALSK